MQQKLKEFVPYFEMEIRENEDITGWFRDSAQNRANGINAMKNHDRRQGHYQTWLHPGSLGRLVQVFPDVLPGVETIVRNHTRYPVFEAILPPHKAALLLNYHIDALVTPFNKVSTSMSGPLPSRMSFCPDCYESDLDGGYPIWHRQFLMPGAMVCDVHDRALMTYCDVCEDSQRLATSNWQIRMSCICKRNLKKVASLSPAEHVANRSYVSHVRRHLAGEQAKEVTGNNILLAVRHECAKNVTHTESPAHHLQRVLTRRIGEIGINRLQFGTSVIRRLSGASSKEGTLHNPLQMLTVMDAVFDDIEHFKETLIEAEQQESTPATVTVSRRKSVKLSSEETTKRSKIARSWLTAVLEESPHITRSELVTLSGFDRNVSHLLHYDREWYDQKIPAKPKTGRPKSELRSQRIETAAINLAAHIKRRHTHGLSIQPAARVTERFVLSGAPSGKKGIVRAHPLVISALAEFTESDQQWRQRYIETACNEVALLDPNNSLANPATYAHLNRNSLSDRICKARRWRPK